MTGAIWQFSLDFFHILVWGGALLGCLVFLLKKVSIHKLILISLAATFFLVSFGAYVRLTDSGLGCPDWPGCYGKLTPSQAMPDISHEEISNPSGPVTVEKAWIEMVHRYLATILGVFILAIFVKTAFSRFNSPGDKSAKMLVPTILLLGLFFQGLLGKWTVTLLLKPAIVTMHLAGGMFILACLGYLAAQHLILSGRLVARPNPFMNNLVFILIPVVFLQIVLGGWVSTNYAALACQDFPTCMGVMLPDMDFREGFNATRDLGLASDGRPLDSAALIAIHWAHRFGALFVTLALAILVFYAVKNTKFKLFGFFILSATFCQIILGISNVLYLRPLFTAVAHNTMAGVLLVLLVMLKSCLQQK